jgi:uncharacterized protein YcfJ
MKIAVITGAVAALAAGAIATPTFAQDYCHEHRQSNGTAGAVVGGLAGAVLGSQVAGHGARTEGSVIGGIAGALIGNSIGRSSAKCDGYGYYDGRYDHGRYYSAPAYSSGYYNNRYDGRYDGRYGYNGYYGRHHDSGYYNNGYYNNGYSYYPY